MPFNHDDVIKAQYETLAAERARAAGEYEAARLSDDGDGTMSASSRLLEIDARVAALDRVTNQYVRQQTQQPQGNRYGLSPTEVEVAHNSHSGGTREERERSYAEQKAKLQHMRQTGQYRDDQGTVRR